jgi:predicted lipoprotein
MNKTIEFSFYWIAVLVLMSGFAACNKEEIPGEEENGKEAFLAPVVQQYVDQTVVSTYKSLADETIVLYDALVNLKENKTNENVRAAGEYWKKARNYWELSEAFLYGAASDFSIDPHIDTWPLALDELITVLNNTAFIASMAGEDGDAWAAEYLGNGLLGFHGIEYILFENGNPKDISKISDKELIYVVAVAGDLRNQCFRLEASWAGIENVTAEKKEKLEELELSITVRGGKLSYGEDMLQAGKPGSTRATVTDAAVDIVEGCITIVDEVGAMKIGKPHTGADPNYIESPYSHNSVVDFIGNIISVQNAYLGGADKTKRGASVSDYIKTVNSGLDTELKTALENTIAKIGAIQEPFTESYASPAAAEAIDACNELLELLESARMELLK